MLSSEDDFVEIAGAEMGDITASVVMLEERVSFKALVEYVEIVD